MGNIKFMPGVYPESDKYEFMKVDFNMYFVSLFLSDYFYKTHTHNHNFLLKKNAT